LDEDEDVEVEVDDAPLFPPPLPDLGTSQT
jgi:hypothetical protein